MAFSSIYFRASYSNLSSHILSAWSWLLPRNYVVIGTSLFGDVFLRDDQGMIVMLNVVNANLQQVAHCIEEFEYDLISEGARPDWVMEPLISQMRAAGIVAGENQCYAFRTPPALGGQFEPQNLVLWDLYQYETGLSSLFQQLAGLSPGTQIIAK